MTYYHLSRIFRRSAIYVTRHHFLYINDAHQEDTINDNDTCLSIMTTEWNFQKVLMKTHRFLKEGPRRLLTLHSGGLKNTSMSSLFKTLILHHLPFNIHLNKFKKHESQLSVHPSDRTKTTQYTHNH